MKLFSAAISLLFTITFIFPHVSADIRNIPVSQKPVEMKSSTAQNFEIGSELSSPVIITPADRSEFRDINHVEVTWRTVARAARYHLILAKDRSFRHIIFEASEVSGNTLIIRDLDYGTYFLKMSSVAKDGKEGPFSDTASFIIAPR